MCDLYGVTRGGYYAWRKRPISLRRQYDLQLMSAITEAHQGFKRAYGAPRLHTELRKKGFPCSVRRVNRLMKELGIKASTTGLYAWRPGQHEFYAGTDNALAKASPAKTQGVQWTGDFTHVRTAKGWLYHAVIIDLFSRKVVGWSFSRQRNTELTKSALTMALSRNAVSSGCIFHSDQGVEYTAH